MGAYSFAMAWAIYKITDAIVTFRVRPEQEESGLDLSQHAESFV